MNLMYQVLLGRLRGHQQACHLLPAYVLALPSPLGGNTPPILERRPIRPLLASNRRACHCQQLLMDLVVLPRCCCCCWWYCWPGEAEMVSRVLLCPSRRWAEPRASPHSTGAATGAVYGRWQPAHPC
jgi:hypothetical protein